MVERINQDRCRRSVREPHAVTDRAKLAAMIEQLRCGHDLPPVVVWADGEHALSGSHRIAAYRAAEQLAWRDEWAGCQLDLDTIPCVYVSTDEMQAALGEDLVDLLDDPNTVCGILYDVTARADLRAALEDQV